MPLVPDRAQRGISNGNSRRSHQRDRKVFVVGIGLLGLIGPAPVAQAQTPPSFGPSITLEVTQGSSPYARWIEVDARVIHGKITHIGVCIEEISACEQQDYGEDPGMVRTVDHCVSGDAQTLWEEFVFPGPGTYRVAADTTADRCFGIGPEQRAETTEHITIEPAPPPPPPPPLRPPIPCADEGVPTATDVGVTGSSVMLGATVITSGPYVSDARYGIEAAVADINASGGVCGRILELDLRDTGGDPATARAHVQAMADRVLALVAMPDPRGLQAASTAGDFTRIELPVVGTTGLSTAEFADPWIWSVGGAPEVFASIVVAHDYAAGARRFGVVTESDDPWLASAHDVVISEIETHGNASLCGEVTLDPAVTHYRTEAHAFDDMCLAGYDAILYLLSPRTFLSWMAEPGVPKGSVANDLPAHLVSRSVVENCQVACNGFVMWDPFQLPIGDDPNLSRYVYAVSQAHPGADPFSAIVEASYVGTYIAAHAIGRVGVNLTRPGLGGVLDSQPFEEDLINPVLVWGQERQPNHCLRAYELRYTGGGFAGWRDDVGWRCR